MCRMACTCSSCRRVHSWTIQNKHRVSTHVRTLPAAPTFRRYDQYPCVGSQGDATNAQSMAKCLEGISGVVLAFQGKSYFSAGRVDEGVIQLWHLHDLHGRLADPTRSCPDMLCGRVQGIKVVATAAKAAGTMRIVLLSSLLVTDRHRY